MEVSTNTNYFVEFQTALIVGVSLLGISILLCLCKSKKNQKI